MPRLVSYLLLFGSIVLWYLLLSGESKGGKKQPIVDLQNEIALDSSGFSSLIDTSLSHNHDEGGGDEKGVWGFGVAASTIHNRDVDSHDFHHYGGHIRRNINHCWRRYDGYNLQSTTINRKEQMKKPYGILCHFKCTWFFTVTFPTCEFIYDYKLSCHLFTSLPDCTAVTCTLLNYFT